MLTYIIHYLRERKKATHIYARITTTTKRSIYTYVKIMKNDLTNGHWTKSCNSDIQIYDAKRIFQ